MPAQPTHEHRPLALTATRNIIVPDSSVDTRVVKLTVNLTPVAAAALNHAAMVNNETRTSAVANALRTYSRLSRLFAAGRTLVLVDDANPSNHRASLP